jgi:hypothetical protein
MRNANWSSYDRRFDEKRVEIGDTAIFHPFSRNDNEIAEATNESYFERN